MSSVSVRISFVTCQNMYLVHTSRNVFCAHVKTISAHDKTVCLVRMSRHVNWHVLSAHVKWHVLSAHVMLICVWCTCQLTCVWCACQLTWVKCACQLTWIYCACLLTCVWYACQAMWASRDVWACLEKPFCFHLYPWFLICPFHALLKL